MLFPNMQTWMPRCCKDLPQSHPKCCICVHAHIPTPLSLYCAPPLYLGVCVASLLCNTSSWNEHDIPNSMLIETITGTAQGGSTTRMINKDKLQLLWSSSSKRLWSCDPQRDSSGSITRIHVYIPCCFVLPFEMDSGNWGQECVWLPIPVFGST